MAFLATLAAAANAPGQAPYTTAQTTSQTTSQTAAQTTSQTTAETGTQQPNQNTLPTLSPLQTPKLIPFKQPVLTPQIVQLVELETKFSEATATGGGKAFATFFADDGVVLGNAQPPIIGKAAITASAQWEAAEYKLSWLPEGAKMSASSDMGFTWGHYTGVAHDAQGKLVTTSGRYLTIWKLMPDKSWKVILESSAQEPPSPAAP